ncbi:hypothetical protein [Clostridium botulinum]|uniref:Uncharacterized protein n=1 Tax=Clostridium botulinum TaxID=1491 RepID=A0A6G4HPD3_CLOBO|nr:hypothetical protein [Clostridium botulinum]MBN3361660.1 hypothetical protein [Clostridium botulinum]MBO0572546.1 hypothetical protein [Clostridium botulinum]NFJ62407.1 hypothetical protein [Clostridium botulinum]NFJ68226.1 hypothetical protein [Clostridium botulinum]NFQ62945.1 hypothetical protein [Clostridium botulinum]
MNKYRVEFRTNSKDYFRKDCSENQLEETKKLIKSIKNQEGTGKCFYRRFPLGKSKKIYF